MESDDKEVIYESVLFCDDETYEKHLRNSIAILDKIVLDNDDVMIEGPMATRVLLDFYQETLRRYLLYGKENNINRGC